MMDAYELWEAHEREQERRLSRCPKCCYCGHPIQDERLFDYEGNLYHVECFEQEFLKWTEDYET